MDFELSIFINRSPETVFTFLQNKDAVERKSDSTVLLLDKVTPGAVKVGTRYREVVQMLPFFQGEINSIITRFDPYNWLAEDFAGAGMYGHLAYQFISEGGGTRLIQRETLHARGILKIFEPIIRLLLLRKLVERLAAIKELLETPELPECYKT